MDNESNYQKNFGHEPEKELLKAIKNHDEYSMCYVVNDCIHKYETDDEIRQVINEHVKECRFCMFARYAYLNLMEGPPDLDQGFGMEK